MGVPVAMVPLELSHTVLVSDEVRRRLQALGGSKSDALSPRPDEAKSPPSVSPFAAVLEDLVTFFAATYDKVFDFKSGPPLHDPCAVAWVVQPSIFKTRLLRVEVECGSALSRGQTVCDYWRSTGRAPNVQVCLGIDVEAFWDMMMACLERANAVSILNRSAPQ
jgi:inosine-uridine nucleoside N-ribohydrolase